MKTPLRATFYTIIFSILYTVLHFASPVLAQNPDSSLFIPVIVSNGDECIHTDVEQTFVDLMRTAPTQGRATLTCNPILQQTARQQSQDMANRTYCKTIDPDGYGPNHRVRTAGYLLPSFYSTAPDANNVQTVACGYSSAQAVWDALLPNEHLEGKGDFWSKQVEYGIAHQEVTGTQYLHYWVIITAEPGQ